MASQVMVAAAARDAAITSLSGLLGDRLSTGELVRQQHGRDASYHPCMPPDAVAFAQSTEEVSEIVKICARHKVPIIPFGSGSGLEGNVVPLRGGVSIDLSLVVCGLVPAILMPLCKPALRTSSSTSSSATRGSFSPEIREPTLPLAEWRQRALQLMYQQGETWD